MADDHWARLVLTVLATWRITHLLANEDGPADLVLRMRKWLGHRPAGRLMDCFNCLSFWIAAPAAFMVASSLTTWILSWLALSGAACLLERLGEKPIVVETNSQPTTGDNDVLR